MSKIIVIGASGLLGQRLCPFLIHRNHEIVKVGRSLTNDYVINVYTLDSVLEIFKLFNPDIVINLSAATNVDYCQSNINHAIGVNFFIPSIISNAIAIFKKKIYLIQFSTDQVYDGSGNHFEDFPNPLNIYGLTKLAGDLSINTDISCVIRTNFFGKSFISRKFSFSDWVINSLKKGERIFLFDDISFNALHMQTLIEIIINIINSRLVGIFNLGAKSGISKSDFGILLANKLKLSLNSVTVTSSEIANFVAPRPKNMTMNVSKIENALGIMCPPIEDEILKTVKDYLYE